MSADWKSEVVVHLGDRFLISAEGIVEYPKPAPGAPPSSAEVQQWAGLLEEAARGNRIGIFEVSGGVDNLLLKHVSA
jgi:hypothetical protein